MHVMYTVIKQVYIDIVGIDHIARFNETFNFFLSCIITQMCMTKINFHTLINLNHVYI